MTSSNYSRANTGATSQNGVLDSREIVSSSYHGMVSMQYALQYIVHIYLVHAYLFILS